MLSSVETIIVVGVGALDLRHAGVLDPRGQVAVARRSVPSLIASRFELPREAGVGRRGRLPVRPLEVRPELERPRLAVGGPLPGCREGRDRLEVRAEADELVPGQLERLVALDERGLVRVRRVHRLGRAQPQGVVVDDRGDRHRRGQQDREGKSGRRARVG